SGDDDLSPITSFATLSNWVMKTEARIDGDTHAIGPLSIAFIRVGGHCTLSEVRINVRDANCTDPTDKESTTPAIEASQANIGGDLEIRDCELLGCIGLEFANVAGQITLAGTLVDCRETSSARTGRCAVNMEGVVVGGHLQVKSSPHARSILHGRLR